MKLSLRRWEGVFFAKTVDDDECNMQIRSCIFQFLRNNRKYKNMKVIMRYKLFSEDPPRLDREFYFFVFLYQEKKKVPLVTARAVDFLVGEIQLCSRELVRRMRFLPASLS